MDMEQENFVQTPNGGPAPEREGQPRMMTIIEAEQDEQTGHWYSPTAVREMLAAEREQIKQWKRELRQMAEDSADRGDVFAQRVLRALDAERRSNIYKEVSADEALAAIRSLKERSD